MPTVPIEIIQIGATGAARYGVVSGRIEGRIRAGIDLTAEACHGIALGIEPGVFGTIGGEAQALLIGGAAQGQLAAQAGVKVMLRLNPNPFESLGLTIEGGAYAFAAAAGRLGVYLTPEYFARFIQDHLDGLPADLFLIFLEEVRAEVGVWGKVAASAAIEGRINAILTLDGENSGFEISGGFNAGWGAGTGWDFYCEAGFTDLRRAVKRSCLRINLEIAREIRRQPTPAATILSSAFDFAFPLAVMTAYDLGVVANRKGVLLTAQDVGAVLTRNFTENLQRYTADSLAECAVKWLVGELRKLYLALAGRSLSDADVALLEARSNDLLDLLDGGELSVDKLNRALAAAIDILDVLDDGELTQVARPLTAFWLAGMLGLRARQMLDSVGGSIDVGSSLVGSTGGAVSMDLLADPPQLVLDEIQASLGQSIAAVDIGVAVDYLVEIGVSPLLARYSPEFEAFRQKLEASFGLSGGDIVEDIVRSMAGVGTLADLNSYVAFKQFLRDELLHDAIRDQLLPLVRQRASAEGNTALVQYLDEVVEPCGALCAEFLFAKLDGMLLADITTLDQAAVRALTENITAGCGVVVFQVLARNLVFFDRIVTDFMLDNAQAGFRELRVAFDQPEHPFVAACRAVLEENLPGNPDLAARSEALRILLLELAAAFEVMTGPTIFTPQRRARIHELKRDVLLSMAGDFGDRGSDAMAALVDHVLDCTHIPNIQKSTELATLLMQIQGECFAVVLQRVVPALAEFYLALTLPDLIALRQQLSTWIQELRDAAEEAIEAYSELADFIRTEIVEVLDAIDEIVDGLRTSLEAHVQGGWAARAKAAIRIRAEELVTAGISDPTARAAALTAFAAAQWLVIGPIIDAAAATLASTVGLLVSTLDDFVDESTDAVEAFVEWQEELEEQLLADLQNMVVVPAADTAEIILDTLFPEYVLGMIEEYLDHRAEQRRLQQEEDERRQALALLEAERDASAARHTGHAHRAALELSIAIPSAEPGRVYPASLRIAVFATDLTDQILAEPRSQRIQFRLNGRALAETRDNWQALPDGGHLWTWQSGDGDEFAPGLNIFEASWIRGADSTRVERRTVQFLVDISAFYPDRDFQITIDADPAGRDVDRESVLIEWNGARPLQLDGWTLRDRVGHRYLMPPGVLLVAGQRLRIFTGGDPAQDAVASAVAEKVLHMGRRAAIWNNEGDLLELIDGHGVIAVSKGYGDFFGREA